MENKDTKFLVAAILSIFVILILSDNLIQKIINNEENLETYLGAVPLSNNLRDQVAIKEYMVTFETPKLANVQNYDGVILRLNKDSEKLEGAITSNDAGKYASAINPIILAEMEKKW